MSNRKPMNAYERSIGAAGVLFPHGSMLTELQVGVKARIRGSGDDLPDFYHTIRVSQERAKSNAFGRPLKFRDVAHLGAASRFSRIFAWLFCLLSALHAYLRMARGTN